MKDDDNIKKDEENKEEDEDEKQRGWMHEEKDGMGWGGMGKSRDGWMKRWMTKVKDVTK